MWKAVRMLKCGHSFSCTASLLIQGYCYSLNVVEFVPSTPKFLVLVVQSSVWWFWELGHSGRTLGHEGHAFGGDWDNHHGTQVCAWKLGLASLPSQASCLLVSSSLYTLPLGCHPPSGAAQRLNQWSHLNLNFEPPKTELDKPLYLSSRMTPFFFHFNDKIQTNVIARANYTNITLTKVS